jgi:hypothetical protein
LFSVFFLIERWVACSGKLSIAYYAAIHDPVIILVAVISVVADKKVWPKSSISITNTSRNRKTFINHLTILYPKITQKKIKFN